MTVCSVDICKNRADRVNFKTHGVTYHRYPRDAKLKDVWIKATGKAADWFPTKNSTICSIHFEERSYKNSDTHRRLLFPDAVPTLKLRYVYDEKNPDKEQPSSSQASVSKKAAAHFADSTASLDSDDDINESGQETTEKSQHEHYTSSKESQNGTTRLSAGSVFPETPAYSLTQELMMDLHELSDKIHNFYPAALGKQFTLTFQGIDGDKSEYIFKSASETRRSGEHHSNLRCNECGSEIVGFRYKCVSCADYDLCSACEALGLHADHLMMRIAKPIKLKRARTLLQQWCEAMKAAGITTAEEITRSQDEEPELELEHQQPEPSSSKFLLLEPPPLDPLSSTKTAKGKATVKGKAKATKKSTSELLPMKSVPKKRKIETSKEGVTIEIEIKEEPIEDFYNSLNETEVDLPTQDIKLEYSDPLGPDKIKTEVMKADPTSSSTLLEDPGPVASIGEDPRPAPTTSKDSSSATISGDPDYAFQTYTHKPSR